MRTIEYIAVLIVGLGFALWLALTIVEPIVHAFNRAAVELNAVH